MDDDTTSDDQDYSDMLNSGRYYYASKYFPGMTTTPGAYNNNNNNKRLNNNDDDESSNNDDEVEDENKNNNRMETIPLTPSSALSPPPTYEEDSVLPAAARHRSNRDQSPLNHDSYYAAAPESTTVFSSSNNTSSSAASSSSTSFQGYTARPGDNTYLAMFRSRPLVVSGRGHDRRREVRKQPSPFDVINQKQLQPNNNSILSASKNINKPIRTEPHVRFATATSRMMTTTTTPAGVGSEKKKSTPTSLFRNTTSEFASASAASYKMATTTTALNARRDRDNNNSTTTSSSMFRNCATSEVASAAHPAIGRATNQSACSSLFRNTTSSKALATADSSQKKMMTTTASIIGGGANNNDSTTATTTTPTCSSFLRHKTSEFAVAASALIAESVPKQKDQSNTALSSRYSNSSSIAKQNRNRSSYNNNNNNNAATISSRSSLPQRPSTALSPEALMPGNDTMTTSSGYMDDLDEGSFIGDVSEVEDDDDTDTDDDSTYSGYYMPSELNSSTRETKAEQTSMQRSKKISSLLLPSSSLSIYSATAANYMSSNQSISESDDDDSLDALMDASLSFSSPTSKDDEFHGGGTSFAELLPSRDKSVVSHDVSTGLGSMQTKQMSVRLSSTICKTQTLTSRPKQEDDLSLVISSSVSNSSHLDGENILCANETDSMERGISFQNSWSSQRSSIRSVQRTTTVRRKTTILQELSHSENLNGVLSTIGKGWQSMYTQIRNFQQSRRPPSLSPRSRNLAHLKFLTAQHKYKVQQLSLMDAEEQNTELIDPEDQFDFVLILQAQEVYAYWAELLDFRVELLGQEVFDAMDEYWTIEGQEEGIADTFVGDRSTIRPPLEQHESKTSEETSSSSSSAASSSSSPTGSNDSSSNSDGCNDASVSFLNTPATGARQRRRANTTDVVVRIKDGENSVLSRTPDAFGRPAFRHSTSRMSIMSPGIYSVATVNTNTVSATGKKTKQQSLFERAVGYSPDMNRDSLQRSASNRSLDTMVVSSQNDKLTTPRANALGNTSNYVYGANATNAISSILNTTATSRRRFGNHIIACQQESTPIRVLDRKNTNALDISPESNQQEADINNANCENTDPNTSNENNPSLDVEKLILSPRDTNEIRMTDIPNQTIARGIAARTNRTNGMIPFLNALKHGVVLRRHRAGTDATFCRILSDDDGDTIQYVPVDYDEAINSFKEQRIRFNNSNKKQHQRFVDSTCCPDKLAEAQPWSLKPQSALSCEDKNIHGKIGNDFCVPDYVAAEEYRKTKLQDFGGIGSCVTDMASKIVSTGSVKIADIVAVHPARNKDPRSDAGELASVTLRKSKSEFNPNLSFSLVLRTGTRAARGFKGKIDELENKWHERQGNETLFKYIDFEAATEGEYWLVLRGLLLLHRDAAVGRFAKQRAAGIGGRSENINEEHNRLHEDEFHEPKTVGFVEKMIVKLRDLDMTYMQGYQLEGARPPPSDYFLGFRSPGTAIWSRLRQAGLETRRIYSLDPRRVMIKVRCPPDRLLDVAEVLRVKIKTKEGSYAPFREDMIDMYDSKFDSTEGPFTITPDFQFKSSVRQLITNFIIGSRIRDSGAELNPTTDLGRMIEARVPLHMHAKLDAIFDAWFFFWRSSNWYGRDGRGLSHEKFKEPKAMDVTYGDDDSSNNSALKEAERLPHFFVRFFAGCLYQPLDSIEQYFGEKVAFYFTWLQHTAMHLVFLSVAGLVVFFCQLASNDVNHPIRPYFSMLIMLWTFVVLINWKKKANSMAYRWGTINYKEQETTRPQFKGRYTRDEVTGEWVVTYPKWKRWLKYCVSFPLTVLFTGGTMILILWVHANRDLQLSRYTVTKENCYSAALQMDFKLSSIGDRAPVADVQLSRENLLDPRFWFLLVALPSMLGLFLPLLNFILMRISYMLNDFENYRTESEYRTYLIIKVFSFRFVCYFSTLYYYAFLSVGDKQDNQDKQAIENGILRVSTGVLVYTTVAQYWQYFLHVCFPLLIRKLRMNHRRKRLGKELREIELEEEEIAKLALKGIDEDLRLRRAQLINKRLLLEQAQDDTWLELMNPMHDSFPEYIQAVVQFTFVSCFSVVLPVTPLIVLVNHLISMRLDAFKLCRGRRRPLAEKTGGIGVWEHLLHIVAVISVLTNCWLMGFTSSQSIWIRKEVGELGIFAIIVGWEHVMLLIKYVMTTATSTLPKSVRDAMKKEQYNLDQQRNALMRARRHQRDHEDFALGLDVVVGPQTLTEMNSKPTAPYGRILEASTSEEKSQDND